MYIEFDIPDEYLVDRLSTLWARAFINVLVEDWAEQHKVKFKIPFISWNRVKLYDEQHYTLFALSFPNIPEMPYNVHK